MKYFFNKYHYERVHGKAPRGRGWWMFEDRDCNIIAEVPGQHTLTEAMRIATEQLTEKGYHSGATVYVSP